MLEKQKPLYPSEIFRKNIEKTAALQRRIIGLEQKIAEQDKIISTLLLTIQTSEKLRLQGNP